MKGGAKVLVEPHRHEGIFVARGKEDALVTLNSTPGVSVYGEKRISVEATGPDGTATKVEYRVWNPFRSKLAAAVLGGVDDIWIKPGYKVLYLGAAAGTSVSHVSDIVGPTGCVYAVEFSHRPGRDLINMAKARTNVIPIIEVSCPCCIGLSLSYFFCIFWLFFLTRFFRFFFSSPINLFLTILLRRHFLLFRMHVIHSNIACL